MKFLILCMLFSSSVLAQAIDSNLLNVAGFIAVSGNDLRSLDNVMTAARRTEQVNCPQVVPEVEVPRIRPLPVLNRRPSGWQFSLQVSLGGPREVFTKEYLSRTDPPLRNELNALISQNFASHADRLSAIAQMCQGKSELEKLQLGALLGGNLARIYDNARANGTVEQGYVPPEAQWTAMREGGAAGVCRDTALTVTQFLNTCGIEADRMRVEGYRSIGGGHQVVTVRGADGKPYTINWSELYTQGEDNRVARSPQPSIVNTDLFYTAYDPITGRILEQRRTELGEVLRAVTGGSTRDRNYFPDLIRLEASNGVISANAFQTTTQAGDFARGASAFLTDTNHRDYVMTAGVAYVQNQRDVNISPTRRDKLQQEIIYVSTEATYRPTFEVISTPGTSVTVQPRVGMSAEFYTSNDGLASRESRERNINIVTNGMLGGEVRMVSGNVEVHAGGEANIGITRRIYNTERAEKTPLIGVFLSDWSLEAGTKVQTGDVNINLSGGMMVTSTEIRRTITTGLSDRNDRWRLGTVYSQYERDGRQTDYLSIEAENRWSLERVGEVSLGGNIQRSISDPRDVAARVTMRVRTK